MTHFVVIDIKHNHALLTINDFFRHTFVIWVEHKTIVFDDVYIQIIPQESALETTVQGSVDTKIQYFLIVFI